MKKLASLALLGALTAFTPALAGETPAPAGAKVYFVNLKDGDTVKGPVKVLFGLSGMGVAPAGTEKKNTGHHHILIDRAPLGEGEDGKLGHGNRTGCDRPRVIETLRGTEVVEIAAGGAHSACITSTGELYTWGKGRYGRLGHGDSDDQMRPKLVSQFERTL